MTEIYILINMVLRQMRIVLSVHPEQLKNLAEFKAVQFEHYIIITLYVLFKCPSKGYKAGGHEKLDRRKTVEIHFKNKKQE